jgi:hypothetical protein
MPDWSAPIESVELMAHLNWTLRTVTHANPVWSLMALFGTEFNSYLELRAAMLALRRRGVPNDRMEVLVVHGDGEPYDGDGHVKLVIAQLERTLATPRDASVALTICHKICERYHAYFDAEFRRLRAVVGAA